MHCVSRNITRSGRRCIPRTSTPPLPQVHVYKYCRRTSQDSYGRTSPCSCQASANVNDELSARGVRCRCLSEQCCSFVRVSSNDVIFSEFVLLSIVRVWQTGTDQLGRRKRTNSHRTPVQQLRKITAQLDINFTSCAQFREFVINLVTELGHLLIIRLHSHGKTNRQ